MAAEVANDPQLSPDGTRVVWTAQAPTHEGEHPTSTLWLAEVAAGATGRRFSSDGEHRDHSPRWSPDSRTIAFLSDRIERGTDALFLLPADGGEAGRLVARDRSIQRLAWSPDGTRIVVAVEDDPTEDDERREQERDDAQVYGERWPFARLTLVDVATGTVTPLPSGDHHVMDVVWSPNGDRIAFLATPTPTLESMLGQGLFVLHLDGHEVNRVADAPLGTNLVWRTTEEGAAGRLVWAGSHEREPQCGAAIWSVDPRGGQATLETTDETVCEIGLTASPDGRSALVTVADGLGTRLRWLDGGVAHDEPDGDLRGMAVHRDGERSVLALVRGTANEPWELWLAVDGDLRRVSDHQAAWREVVLASQEPFHWTASDGLDLDGLVLSPPGADAGAGSRLPTVVLVHGGPYARWSAGFHGTPGWWGQWLATAGYRVLLPNPRGGMGHGNAFATCVRGVVGQEDFADVMAMVDAAIDRDLVDPDRLGICGWSQGGFMAAWAVTQTDRFRAAVMGGGVSDWGMLTMDTDVPDFEAALGGSRPWDGPGPHQSARNSPISFASSVTTPVLILHGEKDARLPVNQAIGFGRALRERGVEVEQVIYPREPHGPRERNHHRDLHRRLRTWFDRWLLDGQEVR